MMLIARFDHGLVLIVSIKSWRSGAISHFRGDDNLFSSLDSDVGIVNATIQQSTYTN